MTARRWRFMTLMGSLLAAMPVSSQGERSDDGQSHRRRLIQYDENAIEDQYIVFFRNEVKAAEKMDRLKQSRSLDSSFTILHTYSTILNGAAVTNISESALEDLLMDDDVDFIEQDRPVYLTEAIPDRPSSFEQYLDDGELWGLDRMDSPESLDGIYHYSYTGDSVYVYIFDTGIWFDHPEYLGRVACSLNLMFHDESCNDYHGHGTHVAGIIGGTTYGVAKDVQLRAVKTLNRAGEGRASAVIAGLEYVHLEKELDPTTPVIVNLSLGSSVSIALNTAVDNAVNNNIVVIMAGGNGGIDACTTSPASAAKGIAVGALSQASKKTHGSNYGPCIDIFAYVLRQLY